MSDSGSETSDAMLVIRSDSKSSRNRYARCYSRRTILQLSGSPKVTPPKALKSLSEWYGEYEPPTPGHASNSTGGSAPHRQTSGGRPGKGDTWTDKEKPSWSDRERRERGDRNGPASATTPATGAMGDFRLSGAKALGKDDKERRAIRDNEEALKPWNGNTRGDPIERRRGPGEFVRKDGRAIEEGGWRTAKEARDGPRPARTDRERQLPGTGERERNGDRRRQPAWMDKEEGLPAWAADGPNDTEGALELDASLESSSHADTARSNKANEVSHVDSIQAWKAEMKEIERKRKAEEERALRREMGLPDIEDSKESNSVTINGSNEGVSANMKATTSKEADPSTTAPPPVQKSVFADFLLPGPAGSSGKKEDEKPRSSRFAKIFGANAAAPQNPGLASPTPTAQQGQPSPANMSFASLLSAAAAAPAGGKSPNPQNGDAQSMERLMNMLHMSSTSATTSADASPNPPAAPSILSPNQQHQPQILSRHGHTNIKSRDLVAQAYENAEVAYEPPMGQSLPRHSPPSSARLQHQQIMSQVPPRHQQQRQSVTQQAVNVPLSPESRQVPSASRLANRMSGSASQALQGISAEPSQPSRREFAQPPPSAMSPNSAYPGNLGVPLYNQQSSGPLQNAARSPQSSRSAAADPPAQQGEQQQHQQQQHAHMLALLASQLQPPRQAQPAPHQMYGQPNGQQMPPMQNQYQQQQHQQQRQQQGNPPFAGPFPPQGQLPRQYPSPPLSNFGGQHFAPRAMPGQQLPPHQQQQHFNHKYQNPPPPPQPQHNFAPQNALAQLIAQGARAQQPRYPAPQQQHPQQPQQQQQLTPPQQPFPQQMQQNQIDLMALLTGAARR